MGNSKILIVDDNADIVMLLQEILEMQDMVVSIAYNKDDALRIYQQEKFDWVISDLNIGSYNGVDLIKEMNKFYPTNFVITSGIPFISNDNDPDMPKIAGFLPKPFQFNELFTILGV